MTIFYKFQNMFHQKGNVTFLFIFILIASASISLLAMTQIQHLWEYGQTSSLYFKTYYLWKAWMELALVETKTRWFGFWFQSTSWNALITENFWSVENSDFEKYFSFSIVGTSSFIGNDSFLSNCDNNNYLLSWHSTLVVPLFYDKWSDSHVGNLSDVQTGDLESYSTSTISFARHPNTWLILSRFSYDWNDFSYEMTGSKNLGFWGTDTITNSYLTFYNPWNDVVQFCLTGNSLTLDTQKIEVHAKYRDTEIWMTAFYQHPFPTFLWQVWNFNSL